MIDLKYCPKCGNPTLHWDGEKKWNCSHCDYVMFHNVAGAVAVLVTCGDEIMLTRRNQEPGKGKLDLSGGFTDPEESAEHTCARELYEELKLIVQEERLQYLGSLPNVYLYKEVPYNTLDLFFKYDVESKFEVSLEESEVSEVVWLRKEEINIEEIAFESQKKFFRKYLND